MKKGYWVVTYRSISDEWALKAYGALAVPAVESLGGRFLTRAPSQIRAYEAGLQQRAVLVEFDSYEMALAAHESEAYQKALQAPRVRCRPRKRADYELYSFGTFTALSDTHS